MLNEKYQKNIIIGIVIIFIGTCFVPSINGTLDEKLLVKNDKVIVLNNVPEIFYPTDDSYVSSRIPSQNAGHLITLAIKNGGSGNDWAAQPVIKFDISSISSKTDIKSATLNIFYRDYHDNNPSGRELTIYRLKGDWNEDTITWDNMPVHHNEVTSSIYAPNSPSNWMQWDVTSDAQDFITGQTENYGWIIKDEQYWGGTNIPGMYCNSKEYGGDYIPYLKIEINEAPSPPLITGPTNGKAGTGYEYTFIGFDPEDNDVYYWIEWGDDSVIEWFGPYESGDQITISHTWLINGTYIIKAKTKDSYDLESEWATLEVRMPKNKIINSFERFLENHPHLFPLLQHLLGL